MVYLYACDLYCDDCGAETRRYIVEAYTPEQREMFLGDDEDSDDIPSEVDEGESDCPHHCHEGENCPNAEILPSGRAVGALLTERLTDDGVAYVREQLARGGELAELWGERFGISLEGGD